jgi:lysophospholipase L1-like esterase
MRCWNRKIGIAAAAGAFALGTSVRAGVTTYMALGDSITEGKFVGDGGYRQDLQNLLAAGGYSYNFVGQEDDGNPANYTGYSIGMADPNHEGFASFRIDELLNGGTEDGHTAPPIGTTLAQYQPNVVLLMIGTNDILQSYYTSTAPSRLDSLVNAIVTDDAGVTLVLAGITPLGKDEAAFDTAAQTYNAAIPGIVSKYDAMGDNVIFADMHSALNNSTDLGSDGVHPSASGYSKMANVWYQALTTSTLTGPPTTGPGLSFSSATFRADTQNYSLGWSFSTGSNPVTVTALSYINDGSNATHSVGIYVDSTHQPVATGTVSVGANANAGTFSSVALNTPVTLLANTTYDIEGTEQGVGYYVNAQNVSVNPGVTYLSSNYAVSSTLAPPTNAYPLNNPGNFGPNFIVASNSGSRWAPDAAGDWNSASNWNNGVVPNAAGAEADFFGAISSTHTIYSDTPVTVGLINFDNANQYVLAGAGPLTLQASSGNAQIIAEQGSQSIEMPVTAQSNLTINVFQGATLSVANSFTVASGYTITQIGPGALNYPGGITLQSGSQFKFATSSANALSVANTAVASVTGTESVLSVSSLEIAAGGTLDVQNNEVIISYASGQDPISTVKSLLASGYNGGAWNGTGIISSTAAQNGHYSLGYADGADGVVPGLSSGQIEIKYALYGDILLQGNVNGADFAILAAHFAKNVTGGWEQGDLNGDGVVNGSDFSLLAANFGKSASGAAIELPQSQWSALDAFAAAHGLLADLPEPASAAFMLLCGGGLLSRRKTRVRKLSE